MIKVERQGRICELLNKTGAVSVQAMAADLSVSDMTVRRDLDELAKAGVLERVHGGARKPAHAEGVSLTREYTHSEKRTRNAEAKRRIAQAAADLVEPGETVFLGTGTTIEQMAPCLPAERLRIVTNSLSVFNLLEGREDCELCLVGGLYRRSTAAFVGPMAEDAVSSLGIDLAFVGTNGVFEGSLSTSNMEEGRFQQLVLNMSARRCIVADASKLGRRDFYAFYRLADVHAFICDDAATAEQRAALEELTSLILV